MKELRFYGHSDDIVVIEEGDTGRGDEFPFEEEPVVIGVYSEDEEAQLNVVVTYNDQGTWRVGVEQVNDGIAIPDWPMKLYNETEYSVGLSIICPDDIKFKHVNKREEEY